MNQITVTLPDKSTRTYNPGVTPHEIAESIGARLADDALAAQVNSELVDLNIPINEDANIAILTGDTPEGHAILLHSCAHLMAQAVKSFWPEAKLTIGPAIENRFYYDFDVDFTFSDDDLLKIEEKMLEISKEDFPCIRTNLSREEAINIFKDMGEDYKLEIIESIDSDDQLSSYAQGDFVDLCRGPHIPSIGKIKYFKLLNISGAYWRGDENNKMLQRIYGTVFTSKKKLNQYLNFLEEAKKRDHRKLGKELSLYTFDEEVGPGLPLWLPNGTVIMDELETLAKETERTDGFHRVRTPHLTKGSLYEKSGHLDHYRDAMYPSMDVDGTEYYVKPMNCPHHHKIYDSQPKSYRDLPVRLSEYGTCYRYEKSGQLFGLIGGLWLISKTQRGGYVLDSIKLKVPVFGSLLNQSILNKFSKTAGILLNAGVPIIESMNLIGKIVSNRVYQVAIGDATEYIRDGFNITSALRRTEIFPPILLQLTATGEETGELDSLLDRTADYYYKQVNALVERMTTLIEPILILMVGVIIAVMVVITYLPVFYLGAALQSGL